jgi:hypothetical protein
MSMRRTARQFGWVSSVMFMKGGKGALRVGGIAGLANGNAPGGAWYGSGTPFTQSMSHPCKKALITGTKSLPILFRQIDSQ